MYFSALFSRKFTEKGSFLVPQISVPEMSIQEDKIRYKDFKSSDVQCQV